METEAPGKYTNPIDYLKIVFRRKWLIIVPAAIGLVGGIMAALLLPPSWKSSTIILVEEEKIINPLIQNLAVSTTAMQRMQGIRETLLGWTSLVELSKKLGLDKNIHSQIEYENLILGLRKNITVEMSGTKPSDLPSNSIIRISFTGQNPPETLSVAQTLTDILMEKNMEAQTKETNVAIKFITEQLAIYKRKIKESEIAKTEEQLKSLLQDSTEMHPMVKELRARINLARKELDSGEFEVKGSGEALNNATKETLKQELDKIIAAESSAPSGQSIDPGDPTTNANNSIYKLLLMDKVDSTLARDIDVTEEIYNMLLQKLETAKITQRLETSREGTRYTIVDPPRLPLKPAKPNKPLVILMGLLLGAGSGIGLIFGLEFMDQSILDVEDAKKTLGLPILGAISRITTQEAVNKERSRRSFLITIGAIAALVLIIASALFVFLTRR